MTTNTDTSQVGVYAFVLAIMNRWDDDRDLNWNAYTEAFKVTIVDPAACAVSKNVCDASYVYEYDHLAGVTETTIQPTFTLSAGCTGIPAYSCTDNSSGKPSNLCTVNSDDYSLFDTATGELKMLSNSELFHRAGTYDIDIGVSVDG